MCVWAWRRQLALASLDEERSKSEAEKEKAKAASVQRDMLALLEQAQREGLDVKKIASVAAVAVSLLAAGDSESATGSSSKSAFPRRLQP